MCEKKYYTDKTLQKTKHAKRVNIVSIKMIRESSVLYKDRKVSSPLDAVNLMRTFLENEDREKLMVCCLDTKNQPTSISTISIGTLDSSLAHPREVFKVAILSNAASIIIAHNHPSNQVEESAQDRSITQRLKEAGKILGIDVLDHLIIGHGKYLSLKEKGII